VDPLGAVVLGKGVEGGMVGDGGEVEVGGEFIKILRCGCRAYEGIMMVYARARGARCMHDA
jgi:hypothetical protein